MKVYKHFSTFVLLTVCAFFVQIHAKSSLCGDWLQYKDELCYKILSDDLQTFDEAKRHCTRESFQYDQFSMAIIRSKEEQEFLANYLFKTEKKVENFWIGAKYDNDTFHWVDNSKLGYTNWLKAIKNKTDTCVQMQAEEGWIGKWLDVPCTVKSLVVCQHVQLTQARLAEAYEAALHQHQGLVAEVNKAIQLQNGIISEANKTIEEANKKISQKKYEIYEANKKLVEHKNKVQVENAIFENLQRRFFDRAQDLDIVLFPGCSIREFVWANFSNTCSIDGFCELHRDKLYTFEMKFVANQDSRSIQVNRTLGDAELNDNINEDGCKYVKCPLVKGQEYSFIVDKYEAAEMNSSGTSAFQITLTGDNGTLACSSSYVNVYGYKPTTTPKSIM